MIKPLEAGSNIKRHWRTTNRLLEFTEGVAQRVWNLEHPNDRRNQTLGPREFWHPFRIYVFPRSQRASPGSADWRKFRVRSGYIVGTNPDPIVCSGTDGAENSRETTIDEADVADITVDSGESFYWFWIEVDEEAGTAVLDHGTTRPDAWSITTIPIGWVDTNVWASDHRARIFQLLCTDAIIPCLTFPEEE